MSQFNNVSIIKQANIYFEGKVTSRTVLFSDGTKKTLGIMMPGEYEFSTELEELMEILNGELRVLLPDSDKWIEIIGSGQFTVPAGAKFKLEISKITDYCCSYIAV